MMPQVRSADRKTWEEIPLPSPPAHQVIPLRPLTVGEILDSAINLLRTRLVALLGTAAALASAEQVLLYFLRRSAGANPPLYLPLGTHGLGNQTNTFLLLVATLSTEAAALTVLDTIAARAAHIGIGGTGRDAGDRSQSGTGRSDTGRSGWAGMLVKAMLAVLPISVLTGIALALCGIPWFWAFGTVGMTGAAIAVEGRGPLAAVRRSISLSTREGLRAGWIRLAGWIGWLAIRAAAAIGTSKLLVRVLPIEHSTLLVTSISFALVNSVAYATLSCIDAVNYLDVRMRTEGLDISVGRAAASGGGFAEVLR